MLSIDIRIAAVTAQSFNSADAKGGLAAFARGERVDHRS